MIQERTESSSLTHNRTTQLSLFDKEIISSPTDRQKFKIEISNEKLRAPNEDEPVKIKLGNILVLPKQSKLEWDMMTLNLSEEKVIAHYKQERVDVLNIISAHKAHNRSIGVLKEYIKPEQFLRRESYKNEEMRDKISKADLVIAIGGDDHIKFVSHLIDDTFLLALNSDPERSTGALTSGTVADFSEALEKLTNGEFLVEEWTRLSTTLNGTLLPLCCSEIYLGEERARFGSRSTIQYRNETYSTKGSGILVAPGTGSTGWFRSASRYEFKEDHTWPKTELHAEFIVKEPYGDIDKETLLSGSLEPKEEIIITSSNNHEGELSVDSLSNHAFNRGSEARIRISDKPLKVLSL